MIMHPMKLLRVFSPPTEIPQEFSREFCMNSRDTTLENANFPMEWTLSFQFNKISKEVLCDVSEGKQMENY